MATNPFTAPVITGYNSSPPPDDGSKTSANKVSWDKHKTKLSDPIKTLAEAIASAMVAGGAKLINTDADENNAMAGSLAHTPSELTIASGSVTATRSVHSIDTESNASTDNLTNIDIASVEDGCLLIIYQEDASREIVVKDQAGGTGQIHTVDGNDLSISNGLDAMYLRRTGDDWYEMFRSFSTSAFDDEQNVVAVQMYS